MFVPEFEKVIQIPDTIFEPAIVLVELFVLMNMNIRSN